MKSLLVLTVVSVCAAEAQFLYGGYPVAYSNPLTYTYTPQVTKLVPKEVEVPVETLTYAIKDTGCKNVFGFSVPCLAEGEARKRRDADEAEAAEAVAPAATLPLAYAGYPYLGGYPYTFGGYGYPYAAHFAAPAVKIAEPEVTEVEVPHYVYKPVLKTVDLPPLCHNGYGIAVPCA